MTVAAHNVKTPHYRASSTRNIRSGSSQRVSMLQALQPQLYNAKYSGKPRTAVAKITQWLRQQDEPVTIEQMVVGSGCTKSVVNDQIRAGHIAGLVRCGTINKVKTYQLREKRIAYLMKVHGFALISGDEGSDVYRNASGLEVQVSADKIHFRKQGEKMRTTLTLSELEQILGT